MKQSKRKPPDIYRPIPAGGDSGHQRHLPRNGRHTNKAHAPSFAHRKPSSKLQNDYIATVETIATIATIATKSSNKGRRLC